MLELKSLVEYSGPEELIVAVQDHLENTPGFVGRDPHPAFRFFQEETDEKTLLQFFHGFASHNVLLSYKALIALSELSGKILRAGHSDSPDPIQSNIFVNAQAVLKNLLEEITDPVTGGRAGAENGTLTLLMGRGSR